MFLLDTNVLSELIKPRPDRAVSRRVLEAPAGTLFASEITRYELRYGAFLDRRPDPFWARIQAVILPIPLWLPHHRRDQRTDRHDSRAPSAHRARCRRHRSIHRGHSPGPRPAWLRGISAPPTSRS